MDSWGLVMGVVRGKGRISKVRKGEEVRVRMLCRRLSSVLLLLNIICRKL